MAEDTTTIAVYDDTREKLEAIAHVLNRRRRATMADVVEHIVDYYITVSKPPINQRRAAEGR